MCIRNQNFLWIYRINRNIVECKLELQYAIDTPESGINRNIVECKLQKPHGCYNRQHMN